MSSPLYHGTAWPLKEGEDLTYDAAPVQNFDAEFMDYEGKVHATTNLQAAQFYAYLASDNAPFPKRPEPRVFTVEHTGTQLDEDPNDPMSGGIVSDKLTVTGEHHADSWPNFGIDTDESGEVVLDRWWETL